MEMNEEEKQALYAHAANEFGTERQMRKCQEECAELIAAINRLVEAHYAAKAGDQVLNPPQEAKVIEELADVEIMVEQLKGFVGVTKVEAIKRLKLRRLQERLGIDPWSPK
jgi:NTP pyrophosphatase (non-canonical NTP hydrolase)